MKPLKFKPLRTPGKSVLNKTFIPNNAVSELLNK